MFYTISLFHDVVVLAAGYRPSERVDHLFDSLNHVVAVRVVVVHVVARSVVAAIELYISFSDTPISS